MLHIDTSQLLINRHLSTDLSGESVIWNQRPPAVSALRQVHTIRLDCHVVHQLWGHVTIQDHVVCTADRQVVGLRSYTNLPPVNDAVSRSVNVFSSFLFL